MIVKRGVVFLATVVCLSGLLDFFPAAAQTKSRAKVRLKTPKRLIDFNYPTHLDAKISSLEDEAKHAAPKDPDDSKPGKKRLLLLRARDQLKSVGFKVEMTTHTLAYEQDYEQSRNSFPKYFDDKYYNDESTILKHHGESSHYSYQKDPSDAEQFQVWVDFANMKLGGGVFGNGFLQEETMFLETPELANVAACDQVTRSPGAGVLEGSPRPMLFKGAHRVIEFEGDVSGWASMSHADLENHATRLSAAEAQQIIVLSIAAPDLSQGSDGPTSVYALRDLFNTFVAGFQLARDVATGVGARHRASQPPGRRHAAVNPVLINTGAIGTGDFHNNRTVVAVVQALAASEVGEVDVKLWGYDSKDVDTVTRYVESIREAYKKSSTPTIKHLIEITHDTFEKTPPPGRPHNRREPPRQRITRPRRS